MQPEIMATAFSSVWLMPSQSAPRSHAMPQPGAHTGADRAAVGAQPPDAGLLVYGDQVAETHRPQDGVVIRAHELAVFPYGHRGGDALIAGAGYDDHRHFTAVHPCVRAGGRHARACVAQS